MLKQFCYKVFWGLILDTIKVLDTAQEMQTEIGNGLF